MFLQPTLDTFGGFEDANEGVHLRLERTDRDEVEERDGGGAGLAFVAVDSDLLSRFKRFGNEGNGSLDAAPGDVGGVGRVDEVQVKVGAADGGQVLLAMRGTSAGVANGLLVAAFRGVNDRVVLQVAERSSANDEGVGQEGDYASSPQYSWKMA